MLLTLTAVGRFNPRHFGWVTETASHGVYRRAVWGIDVSYCLAVAREGFEEPGLDDEEIAWLRSANARRDRDDDTFTALKPDASRTSHFTIHHQVSRLGSISITHFALRTPFPLMLALSVACPAGWAAARLLSRRGRHHRFGSPRPLGRRMTALATVLFLVSVVTVPGWIYTQFGSLYGQWVRQIPPTEASTYSLIQAESAHGILALAFTRWTFTNLQPDWKPPVNIFLAEQDDSPAYVQDWRNAITWWGRLGFSAELKSRPLGDADRRISAPYWFLNLLSVPIPLYWLARKRGWVGAAAWKLPALWVRHPCDAGTVSRVWVRSG